MTALIATSVVRGSQQGESHGGIFLVDLDGHRVLQPVDWNTMNIDWQGRGWDRGLRGIAFDDELIYVAASDELFAFNKEFEQVESFRNPYLKHCHEIVRYRRRLYLTSTGFDSILGFDLDEKRFSFGLHLSRDMGEMACQPFSPTGELGPRAANTLHINSVVCGTRGLFFSGMKTGGLYRFNGRHVIELVTLPEGTHNARPFRDGVLFNDTQGDVVRYVPKDGQERQFRVPRYDESQLTHTDLDDARIARQAFGRGLCVIRDGLIAAGSSPSTITLHDFDRMQTTLSINLSMDVRNAIHGLEVWPYASLPGD